MADSDSVPGSRELHVVVMDGDRIRWRHYWISSLAEAIRLCNQQAERGLDAAIVKFDKGEIVIVMRRHHK